VPAALVARLAVFRHWIIFPFDLAPVLR